MSNQPITPTPHRSPLSTEALGILFTESRTPRRFLPTPVTDEELQAIWELTRWAPTGHNSQPLRAVFARTPETRERILPHLAAGNAIKSKSAPVVAVLAYDTRYHQHLETLTPYNPTLQHHYETNPEERRTKGLFNATLQCAYFILAVRALGLSAGPIGGFDRPALNTALFPNTTYESLLVVNIGHIDNSALHPRLPRLDRNLTITMI
ncbi:malonic semialdehyde reductase [Nocardia sp. CDC160]|uniref:malonic semialdehyde reductase n=1 Tax=Nocardia sp. CDC160 TaxID=3112166 RepID=UPI002DBC93AA|nr:malonic semialdehyde reductase [Nocardia sp. CDC160]MEC3915953.1 malonic semialdehyde reductase [Nocardia sp. CDC160]